MQAIFAIKHVGEDELNASCILLACQDDRQVFFLNKLCFPEPCKVLIEKHILNDWEQKVVPIN